MVRWMWIWMTNAHNSLISPTTVSVPCPLHQLHSAHSFVLSRLICDSCWLLWLTLTPSFTLSLQPPPIISPSRHICFSAAAQDIGSPGHWSTTLSQTRYPLAQPGLLLPSPRFIFSSTPIPHDSPLSTS